MGDRAKNLKNETKGRVGKEEGGEDILGRDRDNDDDERKGRERKTVGGEKNEDDKKTREIV